MATVDPELSELFAKAGRTGGLKRQARLGAEGRAAHVEMMNLARARLREAEQRVDPESQMSPDERRREAKLLLDIEAAEAELTELRERRRKRLEEAELAALGSQLSKLSA
jgi:hypothetical protein